MTVNERSVAGNGVRDGRVRRRPLTPHLIEDGSTARARPTIGGIPVLWRALRHRWYLLVLAGLLGASLGYVVSDRQETVYEADSTLALNDHVLSGAAGAIRPDVATTLVEFHAERVVAPDTLSLAGETLGMDATALDEVVTARPQVAALAVTVTATVAAPGQAARIADAVAFAYEQSANQQGSASQESEQEQLQDRIEVLGERIDEERRTLEARPTDREAMQRLNGLVTQQLELQQQFDDVSDTRAVRVVSSVFPATVPTDPASPLPLRDAALVGFAAVLAMTAAIWFSATDRGDTRSGIGEVVGAPMLAEVRPSDRRGWVTAGSNDTDHLADSMHLISDAIQRFHGGQEATVLITGIGPDDDRRRIARAAAELVARNGETDVSLLWYEQDHNGRRWLAPWQPPAGTWVAERGRFGSDGIVVEPVEELTRGRGPGSLVIVSGPDSGSSQTTNLALASDAVILVVSSRDGVPDLLRLRRLLDVAAVPIMGYIYCRQRH